MFVVMALVTTVATTPLTSSLYPPLYQKKLESWKRGEIDWDGNRLIQEGDSDGIPDNAMEKVRSTQVRRLLVYLRLDSLPSLFTFINLLGGDSSVVPVKTHKSKSGLESVPEGGVSESAKSKRHLEVHGVRMIELTERTSSVMKSSEVDEYSYRDPVVNAFRTFAQLNNIAVSGGVSVVPEGSYAETLTSQASDHSSDLVLIPWTEPSATSEFDLSADTFSAGVRDAFIQETLKTAKCNTAVFVNRGFGGPEAPDRPPLTRTVSGLSLRSHREAPLPPVADRSHHIYFPFFGGVDDRVALRFVLQLAQNTNITATIIHFNTPVQSDLNKSPEVTNELVRTPSAGARGISSQLTISERVDTEALYKGAAADTALLHTLQDSLPMALANRVVFVDVATTTPLADCLNSARQEVGQSPKNAGDLVVVGRGKHLGVSDMEHNPSNLEMRRTLGGVAELLISSGVRASILVIQAGGRGLDA
jgi:hypothetical protein